MSGCAAAAFAPSAPAQLMFSDQTASAGLVVTHAPGNGFLLSTLHNISPMLAGGVAADFNNDGWQDLYVIVGGGGPDKLFINNGDGTFVDQAAAWGVSTPHLGVGAAAGDYNRDGHVDLFLTSFGPANLLPAAGHHKLYRNTGNGSFNEVALSAGVASTGIDGLGPAFGDYNLDGQLDLMVPGWMGTGNWLFRNNGSGSFADVTSATGLLDASVRGFAARFVDTNGDRYPELLVAADFGTSQYYANNANGTFTNMTKSSGTGLDGNGMGQAVGDFNNDGLFDWYVTSVHSVNSGMALVPGTGNMLYLGQGNHEFVESSVAAGVNDGGWGWGTVAIDFDHDGWVDLAETNGWWETNGLGQLEWLNERGYLFMNNGNGTFTEEALDCNYTENVEGRGLLTFDYDNDGDQDIVVFAYNGPVRLYRNDLSGSNTAWLRLFLNTYQNPRLAAHGLGAKITATIGSASSYRFMAGGNNYLSQSELSVHFGFGAATAVDQLRIDWPDGTATVLNNVNVNQTLTINSGYISDITGDGTVNVSDLLRVIHAWGQAGASSADVNATGAVDLQDLLVVLDNWS